ncbi:MAG: hypothetical protein PHQ32_02375 [Firmicutes bacterium]|nr:hypothetical protein [Bacillota bacterium]
MINVSSDFKTAMKQPVKELKSYIKLPDDTYIRSDDDLISVKISSEGALCKTVMKKFEVKLLGEHNLLGVEVNVGIGVKLPGGTYEYLDYGKFLITETTSTKESETTTVVGYDLMIKTMKAYEPFATYPVNLIDFASGLAGQCGLTLGNTVFVNSTWIIPGELYENIKDITYRDIIAQIAEMSGSIAMIGNDDKLYFKSIYDTTEQITYSNLFKLKLEPEYGPINSVVLSRQPQEDNIVVVDQASIDLNGLTEFKISNNWLVDHNREGAITPIFNQLEGIRYYPIEASTEGLGWYEIGDMVEILNDSSEAFSTVILSVSILVDGGISETLITKAESKTATNYSYAGTVGRRLTNTEIKVDKQGQDIELINESLENVTIIIKQDTAPDNPIANDLWLNTLENIIYRYDGTDWQATSISPDVLTDYYTKAEIDVKDNSIISTVEETTGIVSELSTDINNNYLTSEQVQALSDANAQDIVILQSNITTLTQNANGIQVQVTEIINNGVSKVVNTLVDIDESGIGISKSGEEMSLLLGYLANQQVGLQVNRDTTEILGVDNTGVRSIKVTTGSIDIGSNSRIMDFTDEELGAGVGFFFNGGS